MLQSLKHPTRSVLVLATLSSLVSSAPTSGNRLVAKDLAFDYNNQKLRGVNAGGWLVAEPWITPELFEAAGPGAIDEYTIGQAGYDLTEHWNTWITEADFAEMAAAGLNHVRIPIGYWSVVETPPFRFGALEYLDQAVGWAGTHGLKVIVDLHGASLSQNGFDNSGRNGTVQWGSSESVTATQNAVAQLAQRYKDSTSVVTAIQTLNEPLPNQADSYLSIETIRKFDQDCWGSIHNDANQEYVTVVHDAFQGVGAWSDWGNDLQFTMLDTHTYYVFNNEQLAQSQDSRIQSVCSKKGELASSNKWTIVGEWSSAMTDCAKYLNGRDQGARYDGSFKRGPSYGGGSCEGIASGGINGLTEEYKAAIRRFNEAQLDAYEGRTGWVFWTWKTQGAGEWDLQAQLQAGLFPQPLDSRQYGVQCA